MSFGLNASQARARSNADMIVFEEIYVIMKAVITKASAGEYEATVSDGTVMTASNPVTTDSENYHDTWRGVVTDRAAVHQMDAVIKHFQTLGYKIERVTNTATGNSFSWYVYW